MKVISNPNALPTEKKPVKRQNKAILYKNVAKHMNGEFVGYSVPFPVKFILVEHSKGVYEPAIVKNERDKVVEFCSHADVRRQILRWAIDHGPTTEFHWDVDNATKCLKVWLDLTDPIPMPKAACFKNENEYCFVKHHWEPHHMPTPIWNEICSRVGNRIAMKCFWGSLQYEDSYKQQYLWLKGSGQDAKGCLTRLLKKIMGPGCRSANPPVKGQNIGFWLDNVMKAKCLVFSDIDDRKFTSSQIGKCLTGGDEISCEKKFGASYDASFQGKLIFTSNWEPDISSEHSDQRRIIYCDIKPKKNMQFESDYEEKLWREAPGIMYDCMLEYESHCGPNEPIPTNNEQALKIAHENEDEFHLFMERFNICKELNFEKLNENPFIEQTRLTSNMRSFFNVPSDKAAFKKWLERTYPDQVRMTAIKHDGVTKKVVLGLTEKYTVGLV